MKPWAIALLAACAAQPQYSSAPLPAACSHGEIERCAGWMAERDLVAGQLDVYDDPQLHDYVQEVAERLARGASLDRAPRIVIGAHDGTYAAFGERIVIGRMAIERLGSEAELAAIIAHELAHVEGRHASVSLFGPETNEAWLEARRDAEAIADERAVALLERAGYIPAAMPRALAASLDFDDDEHPPRADRIEAVTQLAAGRHEGFEGRTELLQHVNGMIVGRDTRLGMRVAGAWVIGTLGIALELSKRDLVRVDGDALTIRNGHSALTMYPIGIAWAHELGEQLVHRATATTALGSVTVGIAPAMAFVDSPLDRLRRVVRELLPQPAPGAWVVVLARPRGGLVIEVAATSDIYTRDRWLRSLRTASRLELATVEPVRIALHTAAKTAAIKDLVAGCPDPQRALKLDDTSRIVAAGQSFKCSDR